MACYMGCRGCPAKMRWLLFLVFLLAASEWDPPALTPVAGPGKALCGPGRVVT